MPKKYIVELDAEEIEYLQSIVSKGKAAARKILHGRILLKADSGAHGPGWTDARIAEALGVNVRTVERVRQRLVEHGLEDALQRLRAAHGPRKLDGDAEARLIAVACSEPPGGRARWTIRLLSDKMVELEVVESISRETVRKTLKKTRLNLG